MVDIKSLDDLALSTNSDLSGFGRLDNDVTVFSNIDSLKLNSQPVHLHNPVFALCLQGWAKLKVNLGEYDVMPNSLVVVVHDSIVHGYSHSADFKGIFLVVNRKFADEQISDIHSTYQVMTTFKQSPVISLSEEEASSLSAFHEFLVSKISDSRLPNRKAVINSIVQVLYQEFCGIFRSRGEGEPAKYTRNEQIFNRFYELLREHCKEERSVQFYANRLCITPQHLSSMVKKVSGRTAGDWINDYVILCAKTLLRSQNLTVQEVSNELNFASQSFFGKFFKKHVGVSPSEYRTSET